MVNKKITVGGISALLAGVLYISRWVWELSVGILKNMNTSGILTQNFFVVKILFIISLVALAGDVKRQKGVMYSIVAASFGLVWTSITRTVEAYGVSGPWGLFGSPGLLLFLVGTCVAGILLRNSGKYLVRGKFLILIALFSFLGSVSAILFFNLLGRDLFANQFSSALSNLFLIGEGLCWVFLGAHLIREKSSEPSSVTTDQ